MKPLIILMFLSTLLVAVVTTSENVTRAQERQTQNTSTLPPAPIKVTINAAKNALNSVTDRFHVGDQILIPVTMTNTSTSPVSVCSSADLDSKVPTGADAWYESLPPGKYELSIQRRLACCDGPKVQSNKVTFEVLP